MSPPVLVLLGMVVMLQVVAAITASLADDAVAKLHAVNVASVLATVPLVIAVGLGGSSVPHVGKVVLTGALLVASSPFLSRATARAIRIRRTGELAATDAELEAGREAR